MREEKNCVADEWHSVCENRLFPGDDSLISVTSITIHSLLFFLKGTCRGMVLGTVGVQFVSR